MKNTWVVNFELNDKEVIQDLIPDHDTKIEDNSVQEGILCLTLSQQRLLNNCKLKQKNTSASNKITIDIESSKKSQGAIKTQTPRRKVIDYEVNTLTPREQRNPNRIKSLSHNPAMIYDH